MTRPLLALGALCLIVLGFLFAPAAIGADVRRIIAVKAVQAGMPSAGVALLTPLANAGDPASQNNLAVLLNRGIGTNRDPVKAAQLLNAAASAGLPRAQMNLMLIRTPCDTQFAAQTTQDSRRSRGREISVRHPSWPIASSGRCRACRSSKARAACFRPPPLRRRPPIRTRN